MSDSVVGLLFALMLFGWIPILALGSAISSIIEAIRCNKCTCKNCIKEKEED